MAQAITDEIPLLSKPTLRRAVSRRSFAISRRPTIHQLRRKLTRVRTLAARVVLRRPTPASSGIDYFSTKLPAEIRLKIYGYVLAFDVPLKLDPGARRSARPQNLDILRVNHLVHNEAVAALYEYNTVSTERATFCTNVKHSPKADPRSSLSLNHDMIRSIYITSLARSLPCVILQAKPAWPAPAKDACCVYCDPCLLPLIRSLRDMPRLRKAFIDYHAMPYSIRKLHTTLMGTYGRATGLQLTCTGVGKYALTGPWFANTTIELRDVLLAETWGRLRVLPKFSVINILGSYRELRADAKDILTSLSPRFGKPAVKQTIRRLLALFSFHDHGLIPRALSDIWPQDLAMDFRVIDTCGPDRAEFLHLFNGEVQRMCIEGVGYQDVVARRGVVAPLVGTSITFSDDNS